MTLFKKIKPVFRKKNIPIAFVLLLVASVILLLWPLGSSSAVFKYVFSSKSHLNSTEDRVNILLLGIAGGTHDGAILTDSMIVASYQLKTKNVLLISVPRDLWITELNTKVNALYETGKKEGDGLKYTEDKIGNILGIPIHYGVRLDFKGFAQAIDLLQGVEIYIPKTFDDFEYPIEGKEDDLCGNQEEEIDLSTDQATKLNVDPGKRKVFVDVENNIATDAASLNLDCRFEHIHFDAGLTQMNGDSALKFVRSRHGSSGEGSDFARSKRQQLVLQAFRKKVLSFETLINPQKMSSLITTLGDSVETDISLDRFTDFYDLAKKTEKIDSVVLGDVGDGKSLFINPFPSEYGGAWVLIPPNNDFGPVKELIKNKLKEQNEIKVGQ